MPQLLDASRAKCPPDPEAISEVNSVSPQRLGIAAGNGDPVSDLCELPQINHRIAIAGFLPKPRSRPHQLKVRGAVEADTIGADSFQLAGGGASQAGGCDRQGRPICNSPAPSAAKEGYFRGDILAAAASLNYTANAAGTGGTLTVNDGAHTANIALVGQYAASDFHIASDSGNHALVQIEQHAHQMAAAA
jgi:hypothetical protein